VRDVSASRITANDRVRRLLAIVPWIAARDGPTLQEVCERFGLTQAQLLADLDVVFMVGLYPFTPDELIDVVIEEGRVWIRLASYFARPLRLTPEQGLALVAAGSSLAAVQGADPEGPLARGLAKLAAVLGVQDGVSVQLGDAEPEVLDELRRAIEGHRRVELDYYTFGRDERTTRVVDPHRVYADQGQWYLAAWCHLVEGDRLFRVDRIAALRPLEEAFEAVGEAPSHGVFSPRDDDPRVTLDLRPDAAWVVDQYPIEAREARPGGVTRATLAISARPWLERLLVRLGPDAEIVAADAPLDASIGRDAARRVAARYHTG
jgi:proteasome accessory factor C